MMNRKFSFAEIFIFQLIVWMGLWLLNDYVAFLLTFILVAIVVAVLVIALISEFLERSNVPRSYFIIMAISVAAPILAALFYVTLLGGKLDFLQK